VATAKNSTVELVAGDDDSGLRLDVFCAARIDSLSRNQIQKLNKAGGITVDGVKRPDHHALASGETVRVTMPEPQVASAPTPQDIPLSVVYEDDDILVVNKQAGIVVHPAHGNREGTVVNAVLGRGSVLSALGGDERPGVVHRLDKDTSGLLVLAKSDAAYRGLSERIKDRRVEKTYHAIVWGNLGVVEQVIDEPIGRHRVQRQKMAVDRSRGREAVTKVLVVDSFERFDYIRVTTLTGRTHQIRVHLAFISHPILGDPVYGGQRRRGLHSDKRTRDHVSMLLKIMHRQALHASKLSFEHPATLRRLYFKTALPEDMRLVLESLNR
jgi:23S rRNA pseudouridine1911/1915/1917 synthase